jgi:hypothetical protein
MKTLGYQWIKWSARLALAYMALFVMVFVVFVIPFEHDLSQPQTIFITTVDSTWKILILLLIASLLTLFPIALLITTGGLLATVLDGQTKTQKCC